MSLEPDEAERSSTEVLRNVELMLTTKLVHGDLSAFNILYWEGDVTLIDFPQVVDSKENPHAYKIFGRDVQRVCDYFPRAGRRCDARHRQVALGALRRRRTAGRVGRPVTVGEEDEESRVEYVTQKGRPDCRDALFGR